MVKKKQEPVYEATMKRCNHCHEIKPLTEFGCPDKIMKTNKKYTDLLNVCYDCGGRTIKNALREAKKTRNPVRV